MTERRNTSSPAGYMQTARARIKKTVSGVPDWLKVCLIWGCLFLPGLSSIEMSRDELRRALPAITMLETGNWSTPSLGGAEYYRKPPLINWLIASSFYLSGARNAFQARLPVTLCVLWTALAFLLLPQKLLPGKNRLAAALIFLTSIGVVVEGWTATIDPVYACSTTLAFIFWVRGWYAQPRNRWALWLIPGLFIGAGLLLKGPLILLIYYAFLVSFLAVQGRKRELLSPAHFAGLLLALAGCGVWYVAIQHDTSAQQTAFITSVWKDEMAHRMDVSSVELYKWVRRIFGSILFFLPWFCVALPGFSRSDRFAGGWNEEQVRFLKCARFSFFIPLIIINLMPLTKSKYSLPLLPVLCITAAISMTHPWFNRTEVSALWQKFIRAVVLLTIAACLCYTVFAANILLISAIPAAGLLRQSAACIATHINLWSLPAAVLCPAVLLPVLNFIKKPKTLSQLLLAAVVVTAAAFVPLRTASVPLIRNPGMDFARELDLLIPESESFYAIGNAGIRSFSFYSDRRVEPFTSFDALVKPATYLLFPEELQNDFNAYRQRLALQIHSVRSLDYKRDKYIVAELRPSSPAL